MSGENDQILQRISNVEIAIKELNKTVQESMVKQSSDISALNQWKTQVDNELKKCEADRGRIKIDLQEIKNKQQKLDTNQQTAFKRIDDVREENKSDDKRIGSIESKLDKQAGFTKAIAVAGSIITLIATVLAVVASFK